jgi:hypothetical protein
MVTTAAWHEVARPPGEPRGLGTLDGELVALTSDGLFVRDAKAWKALDAARVGVSLLPCGRLVVRRDVAPAAPPDVPDARSGDVAELVAFAVAPDGAVWTGIRQSGVRFYAAPGPQGMDLMHPAYPVSEQLLRDGVVVRDRLAARDLAFDAGGRVWVAATNSLEVLDGGTWRTAITRGANQVAIADDGTIVVGTPTAGYRSIDGGATFAPLPGRATEQGDWGSLDLDAENVRQIERAPDGTMWGRIDGGVLAWTGDRWASRNLGLTMIPRHGSRHLRVVSLAVAGGALHAATSAGVFRRELG